MLTSTQDGWNVVIAEVCATRERSQRCMALFRETSVYPATMLLSVTQGGCSAASACGRRCVALLCVLDVVNLVEVVAILVAQ